MTKLKTHIIDSYDELMQDYLGSPEVEYGNREWTKWYYSIRSKIDPDLWQEFDEFLTANEQMWQAVAEEALYVGVVAGIAERDSFVK